jgi:hypothetical protein
MAFPLLRWRYIEKCLLSHPVDIMNLRNDVLAATAERGVVVTPAPLTMPLQYADRAELSPIIVRKLIILIRAI